jgi:hypothetical protein
MASRQAIPLPQAIASCPGPSCQASMGKQSPSVKGRGARTLTLDMNQQTGTHFQTGI